VAGVIVLVVFSLVSFHGYLDILNSPCFLVRQSLSQTIIFQVTVEAVLPVKMWRPRGSWRGGEGLSLQYTSTFQYAVYIINLDFDLGGRRGPIETGRGMLSEVPEVGSQCLVKKKEQCS
jgi:hypothetical protein